MSGLSALPAISTQNSQPKFVNPAPETRNQVFQIKEGLSGLISLPAISTVDAFQGSLPEPL